MKKLLSILLCLVLVLAMAGCTQPQSPDSCQFYYRSAKPDYSSPTGILDFEVRDCSAFQDDFDLLLESYFAGPTGRGLESPFPRELQITRWEICGDTLILNLNSAFHSLSGIDLTVACCCIAKTFLELMPIEQVQLQFLRPDLSGHRSLTLNGDSMNFFDDSLEQLRTDYTIYYTDRQMRYLIGQTANASLATQEDSIRFLIQRLLTAPFGSDLISPIPVGTRLLDFTVSGGTLTLNFSSEFETQSWHSPQAQRITLLSIVNTLTQIDGIEQVEFCTEGNLLVQYGSLSIAAPFLPEPRAIGPVRTGINEFDATLYLCNGSEPYLLGIPTKIRQTAGIPQEELILNALLSYQSLNGFYSTISNGTKVYSVHTEDGLCRIDLSSEFLDHTSSLPISVHAIAASVCSSKRVDRVQITVDGGVPEGMPPELFEILTPQPDWFV